MKLSSAEGKAVSFILLMIAISILARALSKRDSAEVTLPSSAGVFDAATHQEKPKKQSKPKKERPKPLAPGEHIDPNTATSAELDRLPGVGPSLAATIVKDREANGPFRSVNDLARVKGVSAARARALGEYFNLPQSAAPQLTHQPADPGYPIPINSASAADLDRLPGVSRKVADKIIARRDSLRGFSDWKQVDAIPGVGPKLLERLKSHVSLGR